MKTFKQIKTDSPYDDRIYWELICPVATLEAEDGTKVQIVRGEKGDRYFIYEVDFLSGFHQTVAEIPADIFDVLVTLPSPRG